MSTEPWAYQIPHQHRPREPAGTKIRYDLLLNYRGVLFLLDSQL
ncbi:hypothetical protein XACE116_11950001 [Xanthomonas citri pv. citri]|nr:hypothetical protein XACE116_11950001 [Xanthomonas citri pv. citri]CEJ26137.1 hypothetical protein XACE116_11950001 [Xanthomonas citri pv. citri]